MPSWRPATSPRSRPPICRGSSTCTRSALGGSILLFRWTLRGHRKHEPTNTVFESIAKVNADDAWKLGFRGQGAVVAGADTGVRWTHEALKSRYRGWTGASAVHDYNWHDAMHNPDPTNVCGASAPTPCDDDTLLGGGHRTHAVGTMAAVNKYKDALGTAEGA